jgi:hypothetical protein
MFDITLLSTENLLLKTSMMWFNSVVSTAYSHDKVVKGRIYFISIDQKGIRGTVKDRKSKISIMFKVENQ